VSTEPGALHDGGKLLVKFLGVDRLHAGNGVSRFGLRGHVLGSRPQTPTGRTPCRRYQPVARLLARACALRDKRKRYALSVSRPYGSLQAGQLTGAFGRAGTARPALGDQPVVLAQRLRHGFARLALDQR
jgi:hypothetical protein